jgi:undecaprenyl diphosphate synthase
MEPVNRLPRHVAIIMDGNGRWAQARGLPRIQGHQKGVDTIREIVRAASDLGVSYLTLYAFSKENWARPKDEVSFLMQLLGHYLDAELKEITKKNLRFNAIGRIQDLPGPVQEKLKNNIEATRNNTGMMLTLALSYSSRLEIIEAVKRLCQKVLAGQLSADQIDESTLSNELHTAGMPDPDLLIRTSGELRISNFLLWQISYTELYVTEKYWPDFTKEDFFLAIQDYQKRERRFGRTERAVDVL